MPWNIFKKIGEVCGAVYDAGKKVVNAVVDAGKELIHKVKETFTTTGNEFGKGDDVPGWGCPPPPPPKHDIYGGGGRNDSNDDEEDDYYDDSDDDVYTDWVATAIGVWQERALPKAEKFENIVRNDYKQSYSSILDELSKIMEVKPIQKFINNKSKEFEHQMRDEVNDKISQSNDEFMAIIHDDGKAEKYTRRVYNDAKGRLLKTLKQVIEQTNNFINVYTEKYLSDEKEALAVLREQFEDLSKKGDTREKQLKKIAAEYTSLLYIKEFANKK